MTAELTAGAVGVWADVIGQPEAVATLLRAAQAAWQLSGGDPVAADPAGADPATEQALFAADPGSAGRAMTHAWLITGPPGSGRSNLALGFAAALQCPQAGCGQCQACQQVVAGAHPDVLQFIPELLQIKVDEAKDLIARAAMTPVHGRWNVIIVEDIDRLNDHSAPVLLKEIEEPNSRTVWILCAPTAADVLPTIVSRTRQVGLRTPTSAEVAQALVSRFGAEPAIAAFAARAAQGHIGRAKALATDERVRVRRHEVLRIPLGLRSLGACFQAAANLFQAAAADAAELTDALDATEMAAFERVFGDPSGNTGQAVRMRRAAAGMRKEMEARQKSRRTRAVREQVDRALLDLTGLYRDVLVLQVGAQVSLINAEMRPDLEALAAHTDAVHTQHCLDALAHARLAVAASGALLLVIEALMVQLAGLA